MNMATDPAKLDARPVPAPLPPGPAIPGAKPAVPPPPKSHVGRRRAIEAAIALVVIGGLAVVGTEYWKVWRFEVATDDAYVQADIVTIAPQVSGYLTAVDVTDNQPVKKGDVLATIDPRDYQAAVDQAGADVAEAKATIDDRQAQIAEQQALIEEAKAQIVADEAQATFAEQNNKRFGTLAQDGYGSVETAQQASAQITQAQAQVSRDKAALDAAQKQVATLDAQLEQAKATLAHNQAALDKAKLDLGYTVLRAPVDGVVGARTLRVGQYVEPGTALLAVVPLQATYVVANYKETELSQVEPGQAVSIEVDTFPDRPVRGYVASLAPASGQEFALLPPDNATGNFTKIVQRIPVRIDLDPTDPLAGRLRPGMSVTPTIHIDQRSPAAPATPSPTRS
ncbi:HlyD family secretion protein [Ancylobacter sp. MQZ15Z-1]|uniref:HlyD family secretion protein n=1 Tax=Ancylobacter mangrovi TaxID=2972472 RepID=A0A9X2PEG7_9HYPH|nr:HlyD family secretion protein [Ancylobacter mangrovi]MCS0494673.1 HlyD family secretion protein [Ancylobacter mangrovi]